MIRKSVPQDIIVISDDHVTYTGTDNPETVLVKGSYDSINGAGGDDLIATYNDNGTAFDTIHGGDGNDSIGSSFSHDNYLSGDAGNDQITAGGDYNDSIYGGGGKDNITLSLGHDNYIQGGAGNDTITLVEESHDTIYGGGGNDLIWIWNTGSYEDSQVADGETVIYGNAGSDTFEFTGAGQFSNTGVVNYSTIEDFRVHADSLLFFNSNNEHIAKGDLDVQFVANNAGGTDAVIILSEAHPDGTNATEKVTLVGINEQEWAQVHVA